MRTWIITALICLGLLGIGAPAQAGEFVSAEYRTGTAPDFRLVFQDNYRKPNMHAQQTAKGQNNTMQNVINKLKAAKKDTNSLQRNQRVNSALQ